MDSMVKMCNELNAQVVAKILGREVTRAELEVAFNKVANKTNWKLPISEVIEVSGDFEKMLMREAIVFFAGSVPTFVAKPGAKLPGCRYLVTAPGYYADVGS